MYLLFLGLWSLSSCTQNNSVENQESNNEFSIEPNKRNIIQGEKGSILIIPAGVFVYEDGSEVKETVTIKLEEAYALSDILDKNLDTRAADKLLVTGGMVNIEASTASGKKVGIAKNKGITLQVTENVLDTNNFKFFNQGEVGWENPAPSSPFLTYWPVTKHKSTYIYQDLNDTTSWNSIHFLRSKDEKKGFRLGDSLSLVAFLKHRLIPNFVTAELIDMSFLASKEYEDRFFAIPPVGEVTTWVHLTYVENLDKPLWVVDSLVLEGLKEDISRFDKVEGVNNYHKNGYYKFIHDCYNKLKKFKAQRKTTFSEERFTDEALESLELAYKKLDVNQFIQSYRIRRQGWHNIDYYYKGSALLNTDLSVQCSTEPQKVYIVFKDVKTALKARKRGDGVYCFGRGADCTQKLPHIAAYLVAIGEKEGQLLFAKKEIQVGEKETETLELNPSSKNEIDEALDAIEQAYVN